MFSHLIIIKITQFSLPFQFLRQQRKQQKLQKLQKRLLKPNGITAALETSPLPEGLVHQKRSNPFAKPEPVTKRQRRDETLGEDTIFELIHNTAPQSSTPNVEAIDERVKVNQRTDELSNLHIEDDIVEDEDEKSSKIYKLKELPVDWSIKSRLRITTKAQIIPNSLKSSQTASGLTAFVRCLNMKSTKTRLDISDGARFHQNMMYFVHPNLPWLNLIQRNSPSNNTFQISANELKPLQSDWKESSINLFHLLRTLQCPYFYVLTNHFSILFRAAGIGGHAEMHAFVTPTTRGFRQTLKNEEIEFTLILRQQAANNSDESNSSLKSNHETENEKIEVDHDEEEEEDELEFLESLGVDSSQIRFKEDVKIKRKEAEDDNGDMSTILIEGHDCQSFFNFVLNDAKSIIAQIGRLSGVPPTLIAPVAFLGGTLKNQTVRTSKLKHDGQDFYSIEVKGAILPQAVHTLCSFLVDIKDSFSLSLMGLPSTIAFTKGSKRMLENLDSSRAAADHYFGRENLSDCGLGNDILEALTRVDGEAVNILDGLHYSEENGGFRMI